MATTLSAGLAAAGRAMPRPMISTTARVRPRYELRDMVILLLRESIGAPMAPCPRKCSGFRSSGCAIEKSRERPVGSTSPTKKQITHRKNTMARSSIWEVQRLGHTGNIWLDEDIGGGIEEGHVVREVAGSINPERSRRDPKGLVKMPRLTVRAAQLAATALAFALASRASAVFSLPHGLSFFFPPAGISLAAGAAFGPWEVAGVVLGVIVLPWGAADSIPALLLFGLANGLSAAIPAWVLRHPDGGTGVRLRRVFDYGGVINNLVSAAVGTFALVWLGRAPGQLRPAANDFLLWW